MSDVVSSHYNVMSRPVMLCSVDPNLRGQGEPRSATRLNAMYGNLYVVRYVIIEVCNN